MHFILTSFDVKTDLYSCMHTIVQMTITLLWYIIASCTWYRNTVNVGLNICSMIVPSMEVVEHIVKNGCRMDRHYSVEFLLQVHEGQQNGLNNV